MKHFLVPTLPRGINQTTHRETSHKVWTRNITINAITIQQPRLIKNRDKTTCTNT